MVISAHDFPLWPSIILLMVHNVINTEFGSSNHSNQTNCCISWLVNLPPPNLSPSETKGLIAGLIKGNQWLTALIIRPYFWGGYVSGGWLTSQGSNGRFWRLGIRGRSLVHFLGFRGFVWCQGAMMHRMGVSREIWGFKYYSIMICMHSCRNIWVLNQK